MEACVCVSKTENRKAKPQATNLTFRLMILVESKRVLQEAHNLVVTSENKHFQRYPDIFTG